MTSATMAAVSNVSMRMSVFATDDQHVDLLRLHAKDARRLSITALLVLVFAALPAFAWLALAPLSAAVVTTGFVKVDLDRRPVQHAEGGTVREVLVRDGQRVRRGEPMLVLGDVAVQADRERIAARVWIERASQSRLAAEQRGADTFAFDADAVDAASKDRDIAEHLRKERLLFDTRHQALTAQVTLLRAQQQRMAQERESLEGQIKLAKESLGHQQVELDSNRNLVKDGFVSATRLAQVEAAIVDYKVRLEERRGEVARLEQRMVDNDLRARTLEGEYRQQASAQLEVSSTRLSDLQQELRKTADAAHRQVITAPADGDVIGLRFTSPGAVVGAREPIAHIVPSDTPLMVEARVRPEDVSQVRRGQPADIRFTAFSQRTTPLIRGTVTYVSPDRLVDGATNLPYYVTLIEADREALAAQRNLEIQAGMPAEVFLEGRQRTPLEYLVEPVTQVLARAGRER